MKAARRKKNPMDKWTTFDTLVTIICIVAIFVTMYPMYYVIICSISDPKYVMANQISFWPIGIRFDAYKTIGKNMEFWRAFANSIGYVFIGCILMICNTVAVAYPLTRPNLKFRKILTYYLLVPMYFGGGMIPGFIVVTKLGLYNSPLALIIPGCFSIWNIILCRTFFASLPGELQDAALIDGADAIKALFKVVLPLAKPVLAVILIYTVVGIWNSWFGATIYITKEEYQPVQLYLRKLINSTNVSAAIMKELPKDVQEMIRRLALTGNQLKYAMIVVVTGPILLVYPMFQKHFTKGIMLGSLKG